MSKCLTIDTYVLYKVAESDLNASIFLLKLLDNEYRVAFDFEGHIRREYNTCLDATKKQGGNELLSKWFVQVVSKLAQIYSGKLYNDHKKNLVKLKFDRSDMPFVAVSAKTESKKLISEDSDYNDDIKNYLREEMDVCVLCVLDASSLL